MPSINPKLLGYHSLRHGSSYLPNSSNIIIGKNGRPVPIASRMTILLYAVAHVVDICSEK